MVDQDSMRVLELDVWNEHVASRARLDAARDAAKRARPARGLDESRRALDETREALDLVRRGAGPALRVEADGIDLLVHARDQATPLLARELATLFRFLRQTEFVRASLVALDASPALRAIGHELPDLGALVRELEGAIDERGLLLDSATPKLRTLRLELAELKEQVRRAIERFAARPDVRPLLRATHPSIRDGRYVLAVRAGARGQVRGIYHDRSATGETAYVEPESLVDDQNRLRDLGIDEQREVQRILWHFTRELLDGQSNLEQARDAVVRYDVAVARARVADELGLTEPALEIGGALETSDIRHPILLAFAFEKAEGDVAARRAAAHATVVPFSLRLGDDHDVVVLTGPNTGGKTVTLKAIGLLALLPRIGSFVPAAAGARVPFFGGVFADVGDEQDLRQSLSTFSGHVHRIGAILRAATEGSLVLLDELGSGTDPLEGEALSTALLDHLLQRRLLAVVTTHLGRLKEFAGRRSRATNASMEFDPDTFRPTYRLQLGIPGASNALRIARNLGLPRAILEEAERLSAEHGGAERNRYDELDRARAVVERLREGAATDRREASDALARAAEIERDLLRARSALWPQAESAAEERVRQLLAETEEARRALLQLGGKSARAAGQIVDALRRAVASSPLAERRRAFVVSLKKGDSVLLPKYNEVCRIRKVLRKEERVEVDYRSMSVTVGYDEIAPIEQMHLSPPDRAP